MKKIPNGNHYDPDADTFLWDKPDYGKEEYELARPMEVHECLMYADDHREVISTYKEFDDAMKNGYYLNDGRGTIQGFICE